MNPIMEGVLALLFFSLPFWLPACFIHLRVWLFVRINGYNTVEIPGGAFTDRDFRSVYQEPAVSGRSEGAPLSDLLWYWLAPGPEMHQEHLENGARYEKISAFTKTVLSAPRSRVESLLGECLEKHLEETLPLGDWQLHRVRDFIMPVFAAFYYELVFKEKCTPQVRQLIVDNANDVVTALKCCGLRHMEKRLALTRFLQAKLETYVFSPPFPDGFTTREQAYYLQGTYFNTGVVQMSDAIAHLIMVLAEHPELQDEISDNPDNGVLLKRVINETLRLYPLFGIAHRIARDDVVVGGHEIPRNTTVCFNYEKEQKSGFDDPCHFDPGRWHHLKAGKENFVPFGVGRRSCPAQTIALVSLRIVVKGLLKRYRFNTWADHVRSQPNRSPVLVTVRNRSLMPRWERCVLLAFIKVRDQWENVGRSVLQFVFAIIMILHARYLKLCTHYFQQDQ